MMRHIRSVLVGVLLTIFVAAALIINISKLFQQLPGPAGQADQDEARLIFQRFAPLAELLPHCEPVGYITDLDSRKYPIRAGRQFGLVRYAVSPVLLIWDTEPDYLVANFLDGKTHPELLRKHDLAVVRDFGNGALMLKKERR